MKLSGDEMNKYKLDRSDYVVHLMDDATDKVIKAALMSADKSPRFVHDVSVTFKRTKKMVHFKTALFVFALYAQGIIYCKLYIEF